MDRIAVVNGHLRGRGRYLEIGVFKGTSFWNVEADAKIGVDPRPMGLKLRACVLRTRATGRGTVRVYAETSDEFFARGIGAFDCVLVDGLHTADQAYRDVLNALSMLAPGGVVVMHDCNPATEAAAQPTWDDAGKLPDYNGDWNGDVWKALVRLRTHPDLDVHVVDCDHGVGVVRPGVPTSPLTLMPDEISRMTYRDLASSRRELLDLRSP